jgi:tripartite-type tricarboxylate transporter receptor subunit TctC
MNITRRTVLHAVALAGAGLSPAMLRAQAYPQRPVRIVSPFPPGGSADSMARALAEDLTKRTGQPFVVENKPGAGGGIGADAVAKAAPDGYSIVIGAAGAMAINKFLYKRLPYDPVADFAPISLIGYSPVLLVAHPNRTASTVQELVAQAKAAPGSLSYASNGNGTAHHLTAELFMQAAGIEMVHVPYNGSAPAFQDVVAGRVPYGFLDLTLALPLMAAGRIKGIATTGLKRSAAVPNIPTVAESGLAGFDAVGWFGFFAPKNTPADVIAYLNTHVRSALAESAFQAKALALAVDPQASSPEELARYQKSEMAKWSRVIQLANVTIQ